ncbi:MAG: autotransporter-associated beta strand repeat-containing protein, partial [Chthoniobacterales bacterium]
MKISKLARRLGLLIVFAALLVVAESPDASAQTTSYYWKDQQGNGRWFWGGNQWYVGGGGETGSPDSSGGGIFYFQGNGTTTTYINSGFTGGWFKLNSIYLDSGSSGRSYSIQTENGGTGIELYNKIETLSGSGTLAINCETQLGANAEINAVGNSITLGALRMNGYTLNSYGANSLNITGVISGTGTYNIKNQGITVTYSGSGANTFSGATTVENSSTLTLNKSANTAAIAGALTINSGATLNTSQANQLNNQLVTVNGRFNMNNNSQSFALAGAGTVSMGSATLTNNSTGGDTFSGKLTGTGALIKNNTGTLTLSGTGNDYSGGTTVAGGILRAASIGSGGLTLNSGTFAANDGTARTFT